MQAISRALWYIESHFAEPVTLDEVAQVSGLSRFHLSRIFATVVGQPVIAYMRGRRLTEAAKLLAGGAPDILQIALAHGYGSHEAFSRAFRDQFGATPDETRSRGNLTNLKLVEPIRMPDRKSEARQPDRYITTDKMFFAGLRQYFRFDDRGGIPNIWQAFGPMIGTLPDEMPGGAYGLNLAPAARDDDNGFDYFAAVRVRSLDELPEGLAGARMEGRQWAVFRHAGHVSTIGETCGAAGEWLAESGRMPAQGSMQMIEFYGPEFDARTGKGGCEVWVPVN